MPVVRPGANRSRLLNFENLFVLEREPSEWPYLINEYSPSSIICAQWNGVLKRDRENLELQSTNIELAVNIAIAAKKFRVGTFICFGSQAEAKESRDAIKEEFYDSGESAYGSMKAKLHTQLKALFEDSNCRFVWARIFSVYGPSDFSDSLLMRLFESQQSVKELPILNPSKFWSYLYEDDFASAIEQILKNPTITDTVNVGNPTLHEIKVIIALWHESTSIISTVNQSSQANLGFFPDVTKLKSIGWSPSVSLEEGLESTRKAFTDRFYSK